jgi:geranylgeranyl reductase family protein
METHDAIVIGAGPAGCAAAWDLARAGRSVLLLDRRRFPRVKPCAGGVTIRALSALRYPITPIVRGVATRTVFRLHESGGFTFGGTQPLCAMTVRSELDAFCLERTIEAGAEFRIVRSIEGIEQGADCVVVSTSEGDIRGGYLVGADGANSKVRRLIGGPPLPLGFAIEGCAPMPSDGGPPMTFDFGTAPNGYAWLFPKGDHINVGLYTNDESYRFSRAELSDYARRMLGSGNLENVVGHHIGERGWWARAAGDRVFLVGDAAGLVDTFLGEGIHNAITSGQAAASAIISAVAHRADASQARAAFDAAMKPILDDADLCDRWAERFHSRPRLAMRDIGSFAVRRLLAAGAARGLRWSETKKRFPITPFLPRPRAVAQLRAAARA